LYKKLLNDGSQFGLKISYKEQPSPDGLAQAFILGEDFIGQDNVALILGDNIFYGSGFSEMLMNSVKTVSNESKSVVFGYEVKDPSRYGVVEFDENNEVKSIDEKPSHPKSNYAVVGLYYYTNNVIQIAKDVKPSERGELEITSVNNKYLERGDLKVELMGRGFAWLDTGTIDAINNASNFIRAIEERQGLKVACLEEIAYNNNFIDKRKLEELIKNLPDDYVNYLCRLLDN
jgi:glucose-1-phosphate thymidylyltransferase